VYKKYLIISLKVTYDNPKLAYNKKRQLGTKNIESIQVEEKKLVIRYQGIRPVINHIVIEVWKCSIRPYSHDTF
jgi:hypothetical protein